MEEVEDWKIINVVPELLLRGGGFITLRGETNLTPVPPPERASVSSLKGTHPTSPNPPPGPKSGRLGTGAGSEACIAWASVRKVESGAGPGELVEKNGVSWSW
jgi:hypothetical protein